MKKLFLLFIICSIIWIYHPPHIDAANFDLSITPQIFQIELTPPATATTKQTVTLENSSDEPLHLHLKYQFFKPQGDNGDIEYIQDGQRVGNDPQILDKIALLDNGQEVNSLTISPKSKKQLDLTVSVPKDEPPDDYYFSVIFLADSPDQQQISGSSGSNAIGGIAMNVLLSIGPKGKTSGQIEEFSTPLFADKGPVPFTVKIKNTSSHFIAPQAQIIITNMFGQKIGKIDLLPLNILANSSRSLPSKEQFADLQLIQDAKKGTTKEDQNTLKNLEKLATFDQAIAIWPEAFLLGPYKATLTVALSDEGPLYVRSIHFIGVPVYIIAAFIIIILLIVAIQRRLAHRERTRSVN
jgi:hypothetical protein